MRDPEQRARALALYGTGMTGQAVAAEMGIPHGTVVRWVRLAEIGRVMVARRERAEKLRADAAQARRRKRIPEAVDGPPPVQRPAAAPVAAEPPAEGAASGKPAPSAAPAEPAPDPDRALACALYAAGRTIAEAARLVGRSADTVGDWIRAAGLTRPHGSSEASRHAARRAGQTRAVRIRAEQQIEAAPRVGKATPRQAAAAGRLSRALQRGVAAPPPPPPARSGVPRLRPEDWPDRGCLWTEGESWQFCGQPVTGAGRPWCAAHVARAWTGGREPSRLHCEAVR